MKASHRRKSFICRLIILSLIVSSLFVIPVQAGSTSLAKTTIQNGDLYVWYPNHDTGGWSIQSGTSVKLSITLDSAEKNVIYGLRRYNPTRDTLFGTFSGNKTSSATKTVNAKDKYRVYVQNNSASSIVVQSSSYISF